MRKGLITLITLSLAGLVANSCESNELISEYNGYEVRVQDEGSYYKLGIIDKGENKVLDSNDPSITALDFQGSRRFDMIELANVPDRHKFEEYVNLDSLNKIYNHVIKKEGKK